MTIEADRILLTPKGWFGVRAVAMVFDRYARSAPALQEGEMPVVVHSRVA